MTKFSRENYKLPRTPHPVNQALSLQRNEEPEKALLCIFKAVWTKKEHSRLSSINAVYTATNA